MRLKAVSKKTWLGLDQLKLRHDKLESKLAGNHRGHYSNSMKGRFRELPLTKIKLSD